MLRIVITFFVISISATLASAERANSIAFENGSNATYFKDEILECAERGENFAGHYVVCTFSTGTDAQVNFIIDLKERRVVTEFLSELGVEVSLYSNEVIVNPVFWMSGNDPLPSWLSRKFYRFKNGKLILTGENRTPSPKPN